MKKLNNNAGFSLIEMLVAVAILVIMVVGMESGINAGTRAYSDAIFVSNSASLSGIVNSAIGDVLRYSEDIRANPSFADPSVPGFKDETGRTPLTKEKVPFVFSNFEYGIRNGYFQTFNKTDGSPYQGTVNILNLQDENVLPLVNNGAYPNLEIANLSVVMNPIDADGSVHYDCFAISYEIVDMVKTDREHYQVETTVRLLNPEHENADPVPPTPLPGGGGSGGSGSGGDSSGADVPGSGNIPGGETKPCKHDWGEWQITKQPTQEEEGMQVRTCKLCHVTQESAIPKLNPSKPGLSEYEEWNSENRYYRGNIVQFENKLYVSKKGWIGHPNKGKSPTKVEYWEECTLWQPGVSYKVDDVVAYKKKAYKCVTPHSSQNGWEPETVSSLWKKY